MGERVLTFPIRVSAKWAEYAAHKAEFDLRRTEAERNAIARKAAEIARPPTPSKPSEIAILDPDGSDVNEYGAQSLWP